MSSSRWCGCGKNRDKTHGDGERKGVFVGDTEGPGGGTEMYLMWVMERTMPSGRVAQIRRRTKNS